MFTKISDKAAIEEISKPVYSGYADYISNGNKAVYFYDLKQNTDEWLEARRGIPTASSFSKIMTPKFSLSGQVNGYIGSLLADGVADESEEKRFYSDDMKTGHIREKEALANYSFIQGVKTTECGIVYRDSSYSVSCSPDSLAGDNGGVECKNPLLKTHITTLAGGIIPSEHLPQVYGSLYVTGREWWDFVSYHPRANTFIKRVYATDTVNIRGEEVKILSLIHSAMQEFNEKLEAIRKIAYS